MRILRNDIADDFRLEMDERGVGGIAFLNQKTIMERIDKIEGNILGKIGCSATAAQLGEYVSTSDDPFLTDNGAVRMVKAEERIIFRDDTLKLKYSLFSHKGGKMSRFPSNYEFPQMTLVNLIVMWFCGDIVSLQVMKRKKSCSILSLDSSGFRNGVR